MHRYATAPRPTFEELFAQARSGPFMLDAATYPPVCGERSGEVRLSLGPTGAMIVHVEAGPCRADDFRLQLLFETGTCVFSTPARALALLDRAASRPRSGSSRRWERPAAPEPEAGDEDEPPIAEAPDASARCSTSRPLPSTARSPSRSPHGGEPRGRARAASSTARTQRSSASRASRSPSSASATRLGPAPSSCSARRVPARRAPSRHCRPRSRSLGYEGATVFRLDCGELTDSIQLTRLLGSPPGYSGHAATTPLLTALERPGCILLVDEVEKAHPELLDLLLGLLDAGRLRVRPARMSMRATSSWR